jgi:hypothetical protein
MNQDEASQQDLSEADSLPVLETCCDYCRGAGRWREERSCRERCCGMCGGAGFIPTEFGERVLQLIRHNAAILSISQDGQ